MEPEGRGACRNSAWSAADSGSSGQCCAVVLGLAAYFEQNWRIRDGAGSWFPTHSAEESGMDGAPGEDVSVKDERSLFWKIERLAVFRIDHFFFEPGNIFYGQTIQRSPEFTVFSLTDPLHLQRIIAFWG